MTENMDQLVEELKDIKDLKIQHTIFSTLFSRIGAGHEDKEIGAEKIVSPDLDSAWSASNEHLERLANKDLKDAFDAAITISTIKKSDNQKQENTNKWIRGTGLSFLGTDKCQSMLKDYLTNGKKKKILIDSLLENISVNLNNFTNYDSFFDPNGFLAVQSIYIGLEFKNSDNKDVKRIYEAANLKVQLPETRSAAKILSKVPGCEYVVDRI